MADLAADDQADQDQHQQRQQHHGRQLPAFQRSTVRLGALLVVQALLLRLGRRGQGLGQLVVLDHLVLGAGIAGLADDLRRDAGGAQEGIQRRNVGGDELAGRDVDVAAGADGRRRRPGIDADDLAAFIEQRAAGIAVIDRRRVEQGIDARPVRIGRGKQRDRTLGDIGVGRLQKFGAGAVQQMVGDVGIPHRHHALVFIRRQEQLQRRDLEVGRLKQGEIPLGPRLDQVHRLVVGAAILVRNDVDVGRGRLGRHFDDVVIGDDIAGGDDEARPHADRVERRAAETTIDDQHAHDRNLGRFQGIGGIDRLQGLIDGRGGQSDGLRLVVGVGQFRRTGHGPGDQRAQTYGGGETRAGQPLPDTS